jgi:hypothetical protein
LHVEWAGNLSVDLVELKVFLMVRVSFKKKPPSINLKAQQLEAAFPSSYQGRTLDCSRGKAMKSAPNSHHTSIPFQSEKVKNMQMNEFISLPRRWSSFYLALRFLLKCGEKFSPCDNKKDLR